VSEPEQHEFMRPRHVAWLWIGVLAPPVAWALQMGVNYALVPMLCEARHGATAVHLTSLVALLLALVGLWLTWRHWRQSGGGWAAPDDSPAQRTRFIALMGLMLGVLLLATMLMQGLPSLWVPPCE
jgi:hypothetical protein